MLDLLYYLETSHKLRIILIQKYKNFGWGRVLISVLSCFSHIWLFAMLWTVSSQAPLSMGFSRQEYWSGLPYPTLRDLPYPGIELHLLCLLHWQAGSLLLVPPGKPVSAAAAKSLQSCPTLCDPVDGSPPGSAVPGILQARTLEWVAISFSNAWKWKGKVKSLSRVRLLVTPWTAAHQAPLSMGFSRQEYWSGVTLSTVISGSQF